MTDTALRWGSTYIWSDPNFNWEGHATGSEGGPHLQINILYQNIAQQNAILAPQMIRFRTRYRGHRESYKVNMEMSQFLYDVRKLYEFIGFTSYNFVNNVYNIEFGVNEAGYFWSDYYPTQSYDGSLYDANDYDGPTFTSVPSNELTNLALTGTNDIIMRLNRLLKRVELLESTREDAGLASYNSPQYTYNVPVFYNS